MNSRTTVGFRELFGRLPGDVQRQARHAYRLFQQNPHHPGLRFRQVHATEPIYSACVGLHYRAVGVLDGEQIVWFDGMIVKYNSCWAAEPRVGSGKRKTMNIWRLIPHHEDSARLAEWSRRKGVLAIGWGGMGDLRLYDIHNEAEMKRLVAEAHPDFSAGSKANGGRSLWRFRDVMHVGDLVIISASGSRRQTMRVTGDYYFVKSGDDPSHYYEHRRKAEVVPIGPDRLWQAVGRVAGGEGIYSTLVRCTCSLTEAEADALAD